ncbi:MAG TPA: hypothetical protein VIO61_17015 [Anaerolineaceae bacterium]
MQFLTQVLPQALAHIFFPAFLLFLGVICILAPVQFSGRFTTLDHTNWFASLPGAIPNVLPFLLMAIGILVSVLALVLLIRQGIKRVIPEIKSNTLSKPDPAAHDRYRRARSRWDKAYYCQNCNILFLPENPHWVSMPASLVEEIRRNQEEISLYLPPKNDRNPLCPTCHISDAVDSVISTAKTARKKSTARVYSLAAEKFAAVVPNNWFFFWIPGSLITLAAMIQVANLLYSIYLFYMIYGATDFLGYSIHRVQTNPVTLLAYLALLVSLLLMIGFFAGVIRRIQWRFRYYCSRCDRVFTPGMGEGLPLEKIH